MMEHSKVIKCDLCNKVFRDAYDLSRHMKRKSPCDTTKKLEQKPEKRFECELCKKKFTTKGSTNRHTAKCGGLEQQIADIVAKQLKKLLSQQLKQIDPTHTETTNNNFVNNGTVNQQNIDITANFNVNPYNKPDMSKMHIDLNNRSEVSNITKHLFKNIYFNPEMPENHSIYLQNKKEGVLVVKGPDDWKTVRSKEEKDKILTEIGNELIKEGRIYINSPEGPYGGKDENFLKLDGAIQHELVIFNGDGKNQLDEDSAMEVMTDGRNIVLPTLKKVKCPMLK